MLYLSYCTVHDKKPVNIFTDNLNENVFIFNRYHAIGSYDRLCNIVTKNTDGIIGGKKVLYNYAKDDNASFV